jgi:CheY-like chemotaxis protein
MANILVVEDDPLFRDAVINFLSLQGHLVESASSAEEALGKARAATFDLLLNDIRIAGQLDGVEALAMIRKLQPQIRCILMTGFADADAPLRAARLQADDYLLKPFKLHTLRRSVESVLEKDFDAPPGLTQNPGPDLRWLFDDRLQLLEAHREICVHQFFLLVRSQRLSLDDAYALFCSWEALEIDYYDHQNPLHWDRLTIAYREWTQALNSMKIPSRTSETIPYLRFELLYARIQSGVIQTRQLLQAIRLLHWTPLRHENLQAYCTYHWLWSDQLDQGDPFLGLALKGYRLLRHRSAPSPMVRLYEAEAEVRPKNGDMVLCVPDKQDWQLLITSELRSERASSLATTFGHHFLLYQGYSFSLQARLPRRGTDYGHAWKILRPIFLQVAAFHQQNRCSGCFCLRDIDSPPGQPCSLSHFSEAGYREAHREFQAGHPISDFHSAPEVVHQARPTAASDQAVLGRLLFEVVHGGRYPNPALRLHMRTLGDPDSNRNFAPYLQPLGPLTAAFYRLAHSDPKERFARLEDAIGAIDSAVRIATS